VSLIYRQRRRQRRCSSGEAKPHLSGWWGLPRRSPPASLLRDSPIRAVGADCPEPGWNITTEQWFEEEWREAQEYGSPLIDLESLNGLTEGWDED
jgi:hypothetical protein